MATQTPEFPIPNSPEANDSDPVAQTLALLQPWIEYVPKRQRRLGLFIFLACLLHFAAFFFIRIDSSRAELRHQARIHVSMEDEMPASSREIIARDDFWGRLTDPRLFIMPLDPQASLSASEPSLDFTAGNITSDSAQFPAPIPAEGYQFIQQALPPLTQSVGAAMVPPRQPFAYNETPPAIAPNTQLVWDDALAVRQPSGVPDLPSPVSDTDLLPTELRVAVNPDGTVEHVMLEQSCGSGRLDLDQQAILAARKVRFHSTDQPGLLWGRVTVFWHYAATPREEVVPTPPSST